jgi:hypothetical protein
MSLWRWSFLCHISAWFLLAILALYVEPVPRTATLVIVYLVLLPRLVHDLFLPAEEPAITAFWVYLWVWAIGIVSWVVVAFRGWIDHETKALCLFAHFLIAICGLICVVVVGQVNFPFRE